MTRAQLRAVPKPLLGIAPVWDLMRLQWWRWALAELSARDPLHIDLPMIVRRVNELEARVA